MQVDFAIKEKGASAPTMISSEIVDLIAFEQEFDVSIAVLSDAPKLSHLTWLAWHAMQRTGRTQLGFMEWSATLEDITGEEAGEVVPLESTASTGSSPVSQ